MEGGDNADGESARFNTFVIAIGLRVQLFQEHMRHMEAYPGCSWMALDHMVHGTASLDEIMHKVRAALGDDEEEEEPEEEAEEGAKKEATPSEQFWDRFIGTVTRQMFPMARDMRIEMHASHFDIAGVYGWDCPPKVKVQKGDGECIRLATVYPQQHTKDEEEVTRTKGNCILLKVTRKAWTQGNPVGPSSEAADGQEGIFDFIKLGWRYKEGMAQLEVASDGGWEEKDIKDPFSAHPWNGTFATFDVKRSHDAGLLAALGEEAGKKRIAALERSRGKEEDWYGPIWHYEGSEESEFKGSLVRNKAAPEGACGVEMRRAILVHRFLQAYQNTLVIPAQSARAAVASKGCCTPVREKDELRSNMLRVGGSAALKTFKSRYLDNIAFLTASKFKLQGGNDAKSAAELKIMQGYIAALEQSTAYRRKHGGGKAPAATTPPAEAPGEEDVKLEQNAAAEGEDNEDDEDDEEDFDNKD